MAAPRTVEGVTVPADSIRVQLGTQALPATLRIGTSGPSLQGLFAFSQVTGTVAPGSPAGTQPPVTAYVAASDVALDLGPVKVTGGSGLFVFGSSGGLAGQFQASVSITAGPVGLSGTFSVAANSTSHPSAGVDHPRLPDHRHRRSRRSGGEPLPRGDRHRHHRHHRRTAVLR